MPEQYARLQSKHPGTKLCEAGHISESPCGPNVVGSSVVTAVEVARSASQVPARSGCESVQLLFLLGEYTLFEQCEDVITKLATSDERIERIIRDEVDTKAADLFLDLLHGGSMHFGHLMPQSKVRRLRRGEHDQPNGEIPAVSSWRKLKRWCPPFLNRANGVLLGPLKT